MRDTCFQTEVTRPVPDGGAASGLDLEMKIDGPCRLRNVTVGPGENVSRTTVSIRIRVDDIPARSIVMVPQATAWQSVGIAHPVTWGGDIPVGKAEQLSLRARVQNLTGSTVIWSMVANVEDL